MFFQSTFRRTIYIVKVLKILLLCVVSIQERFVFQDWFIMARVRYLFCAQQTMGQFKKRLPYARATAPLWSTPYVMKGKNKLLTAEFAARTNLAAA